MTILLTPDTVKQGGREAELERARRVRDLSDEESRLAASVNALREEERAEKERIDAEVQKMRNETAAERVELDLDIASRREQRRELMKPIDEIRRAAEEKLKDAEKRQAALADREASSAARARELDERETAFMEECADRRQELDEREEKVARREKMAREEEARLKESGRTLNGNWAAYHEAVDRKNAEIADREAKAATAEKANADRAEELDRRARRIAEDDRAVRDKYTALEQAKKHLRIDTP